MLGYNRRLERLENYWIADHATAPPDPTLILVMDMYEHAQQMDLEARAAQSIDAFFSNIDWQIVW
jgi:superoxide dismutase